MNVINSLRCFAFNEISISNGRDVEALWKLLVPKKRLSHVVKDQQTPTRRRRQEALWVAAAGIRGGGQTWCATRCHDEIQSETLDSARSADSAVQFTNAVGQCYELNELMLLTIYFHAIHVICRKMQSVQAVVLLTWGWGMAAWPYA